MAITKALMKTSGWMALSLTTLAGLGGCDTVRAPGGATPDPLPRVAYPKIEAAEGLSGFLSYDEPKTVSERPLSIQTPIRARTEKEDLNVQYRYVFFDDRGIALNPDAAWMFMKLASRRQQYMTGSAMTNKAVDWRLQIRPAK